MSEEQAAGQETGQEQQSTPEISEGMSDEQAWSALDNYIRGDQSGQQEQEGTGDAPGEEESGQTLSLTTQQLNERLNRARQSFLKEYGFESEDQLKGAVEAYRQAEEAKKTEVERAYERGQKEIFERFGVESPDDLQELFTEATTAMVHSQLRDALDKSGVRPQRREAAIELMNLDSIEFDEESGAVSNADALINDVRERVPEIFGEPRRSAPDTTQQTSARPDFNSMSREEFQQFTQAVLSGQAEQPR